MSEALMAAPRCDGHQSVHALTVWWHAETQREFDLCGHCSNRNADALTSSGWALLVDERVEALHPSLGPVTSDERTH